MKKISLKVLCIVFAVMMCLLAGCGGGKDNAGETAAPTATPEPELSVKDLLAQLKNTEFTDAKHIFLFIGDGMSPNEVEETKILFRDDCIAGAGEIAFEQLPNVGTNKTLCAESNPEPDSASGGTAFACGYKSMRKRLGMDFQGNEIKNVAELAKEKGMGVGIITTESIVDATPATFSVHMMNRDDESVVAQNQITGSQADFIIGGGREMYQKAAKNEYKDGKTYEDYMKENNITWANTWDEVLAYKKQGNSRLIATLCDDLFESYKEEPSLAEMTKKSIEMLSEQDNGNGFFLMVEGGAMDESAHASDMPETCRQIIELDKAIVEALKFAKDHPDTLIIVSADHNTGNALPKEEAAKFKERNQKTNPNVKKCVEFTEELNKKYGYDLTELDYVYSTIAHTNEEVKIYAIGKGTEIFKDAKTPTFQIGKFLGQTIGDPNFGAQKSNGKS